MHFVKLFFVDLVVSNMDTMHQASVQGQIGDSMGCSNDPPSPNLQDSAAGVGDGAEGLGDSSWCTNPSVKLQLDDSDAASEAAEYIVDVYSSEDEEDDATSLATKKRRVA